MEILHALLSQLLSLGVAVVLFFSGVVASYTAQPAPISIAPKAEVPAAPAPASTPTVASSTPPAKSTAPAVKPKSASPASAKSIASTTPPAVPPPATVAALDPTLLNTQTRDGLVNILCLTQSSAVHAISASGVFIDNRGVILTNAHVGQFFLLKDYPFPNDVDCTVRTGSPAQPLYHATLLYLPPTWIIDNATQLTAQQAMGTGENDYAFLLVTGTTNPAAALPSSFPALPMTAQEPALNESVLLAAYPASFLGGIDIEKNLYATSAYAIVKELFTFGASNDIDLVSVGGTVVSQGGSSGGAMVRAQDGKLQGIIATATTADTTAGRDLRAITLAHINRSLESFGKGGVADLLSQDLTVEAAQFNASVAPGEEAQLVQALQNP